MMERRGIEMDETVLLCLEVNMANKPDGVRDVEFADLQANCEYGGTSPLLDGWAIVTAISLLVKMP